MKYKITASYKNYCTTEVEAKNKEEAIQKGHAMDGGDFDPINLPNDDGQWTIEKVELLPENFTEEQQAFMEAYHSNVGCAPPDVVKLFLLTKDDDNFYEDYSEYYSGLADARGVWEDAKSYFKDKK
jgi:hypothetical protein